MNLPDLLRQVAYLLRNNGEPKAPVDDEQPVGRGYSQYICDLLHYYPVSERYEAREYLEGLGMPTGFYAFGHTLNAGEFSLEQQRQRMTWLFFAADLAEELGEEWVQYVRSLNYTRRPHDL